MPGSRARLAVAAHHTFVAGLLGPRSVVIDLGASTASFAIAASRATGCRCHAIEASSSAAALIPEFPGLTAHHLAISDRDGTARFLLDGVGVSAGSLIELAGGHYAASEEVEAVTLETLLDRLRLDRVDLVKVDIEGGEIAMFDAASDHTLARVDQFSVEFHDFVDPSMAAGVARIKARLERLGFAVIVFTRRFHGDVLFVHRGRTGLSQLDVLGMRVSKYWSGGQRWLRRHIDG